MQTHAVNRVEAAQSLNHVGPGLLDNIDVADNQNQRDYENSNDKGHDVTSIK
jgi:hypothetical protein